MLLPALNPAEVWQESGRWDVMGDNLFRLKDRFGRDLCLGMTHEEVMTVDRARRAAQLQATAADLVPDPDQVPRRAASQIGPAARAPVHHEGLLHLRHGPGRPGRRLRQALPGLLPHFRPLRPASTWWWKRIRAPWAAASRTSSWWRRTPARISWRSAPAAATRPTWRRPSRAASAPRPADPEGDLAPEEFHTPGRKTIAEVAEFTGLPETSQMKSLVLVADGKPVLVMLRGDHQLSETKFGAASERSGIPPGASRGDPRVVRRRRRIAGPGGREEHADPRRPRAGGPPQHDRRRQQGRLPPAPRDAWAKISRPRLHDLRQVAAGDLCAQMRRRRSTIRKTVEIGHIFKLGYKYSESMGLRVLNADGKEVTPIMGSYGIGIERILSAAIELYHDKDGMILPAVDRAVPGGGDAGQYRRRRRRRRRRAEIYQDCLRSGARCAARRPRRAARA